MAARRTSRPLTLTAARSIMISVTGLEAGKSAGPDMAMYLREAETRIRQLRRQVEDRLADVERQCARCRRPLTGRPDRKYCSGTCRQQAHQSRHGPKITRPAAMAPSLRQDPPS